MFRRREGLVGRHAHRRRVDSRLQPRMVAARAGQGAICVLFTDGLERDRLEQLSTEMERLHKSSPPHLGQSAAALFGIRGAGFGVRAMLPHVDEFRPIHNLRSMADLVKALAEDRIGLDRSEKVAEGGVMFSLPPLAGEGDKSWRDTNARNRRRHSLRGRKLEARRQGRRDRHGCRDLGLGPRPVGSHLVIDEDGRSSAPFPAAASRATW